MTDKEYRQDDTSDGYCPLCGKPLANLTVAAQGYCERHGWVSADWTPRGCAACEGDPEAHGLHVCGKEPYK